MNSASPPNRLPVGCWIEAVYVIGGSKSLKSSSVIAGFFAISLKGLISSKIQAALPKVPITRSCSLGWIVKSFVETVGKVLESNFCQLIPVFNEKYNPSSLPRKIKLGFNYLNFAKEIIKKSKVELFLVKNNIQLAKFLKKNMYGKKIVIGMGAGSISNWMKELPQLM